LHLDADRYEIGRTQKSSISHRADYQTNRSKQEALVVVQLAEHAIPGGKDVESLEEWLQEEIGDLAEIYGRACPPSGEGIVGLKES